MFNVKQRTLLIIAGIVWIFAGINVTRLGLVSYQTIARSGLLSFSAPMLYLVLAGSLLTFSLFAAMFLKITRKHTRRISAYNEPRPFWNFFDGRSYLLMAVMMGGGIYLRASQLLPECFIALFYTGLGCALALAGMIFVRNFFAFKQV